MDADRPLVRVAAVALDLNRQKEDGLSGEDASELRIETWREMRRALARLAEDDPTAQARCHADARAESLRRLGRVEHLLSTDPGASLEALGQALADGDAAEALPALTEVARCGLVLDDLRTMNDDRTLPEGRIGYAMRLRAWADLARAVERLEAEEPDTHRRVLAAAEALRARLCDAG